MSTMPDKVALRTSMTAQRIGLSPDWVRAHSHQVQARARALPELLSPRAVAGYLATPDEVQTDALLAAIRTRGGRVCVPRKRDPAGYAFAWWGEEDALVEGPFGVREPRQADWVSGPEPLEVVLVPGVAFGAEGERLGHGGGHYDRLLAALPSATVTVGLAFDFQIAPRVPQDTHDIRCNKVITETRIINGPPAR